MTDNTSDVVDKLLEKTKPQHLNSVKFYDKDGNIISELTDEVLKKLSQETLEYMMSDVRRFKDFGMASVIGKQLIELKKAWFPATITSKNLNVNVFSDQVNNCN